MWRALHKSKALITKGFILHGCMDRVCPCMISPHKPFVISTFYLISIQGPSLRRAPIFPAPYAALFVSMQRVKPPTRAAMLFAPGTLVLLRLRRRVSPTLRLRGSRILWQRMARFTAGLVLVMVVPWLCCPACAGVLQDLVGNSTKLKRGRVSRAPGVLAQPESMCSIAH